MFRDCDISPLSFSFKLGLAMPNKRTGFIKGAKKKKNDNAMVLSSRNHNDAMERHKGSNCPVNKLMKEQSQIVN